MEEIEKLKKITKPIIQWYQENKRELPWRKEKNAYHIWISEIMLQQTRIEAVKQYYERFLKQLPTIQDLAKIEEKELLKLWEGLGYYNRARNLKKTAQIIQEQYHGQMPKTYQELIKLPGIGEYTAGAISSIAYNEKVPAVDGNVLRVISRVVGSQKDILEAKTKKEWIEKLQKMMPEQAGDFNEGLMELGEIVCIPNGKPWCETCPLQKFCVANHKNLTNTIPVRKQKIKKKKENITVILLENKKKIAIRKRSQTGLLANMYEFPNINKKMTKQEIEKLLEEWKVNSNNQTIEKIGTHHHVFSHIEWNMIGYKVQVTTTNKELIWVTKQEILEKYPIPGAFIPFREKIL
ncbi:MAG: A/G-specific adenine glycosylase [Clostridia bacterium]|nr:A/G-specific adenine glycosylase [Clostridia bacterium]